MTDYELYKLLDEAGYEPDEENLNLLKENPELIDEWFLTANNVGKKYNKVQNDIEKLEGTEDNASDTKKTKLTTQQQDRLKHLKAKRDRYENKIQTNADYARTMERAADTKQRGLTAINKFKNIKAEQPALAENEELNNYLDILLENISKKNETKTYTTDGNVVSQSATQGVTPENKPKDQVMTAEDIEKIKKYDEAEVEKAKKARQARDRITKDDADDLDKFRRKQQLFQTALKSAGAAGAGLAALGLGTAAMKIPNNVGRGAVGAAVGATAGAGIAHTINSIKKKNQEINDKRDKSDKNKKELLKEEDVNIYIEKIINLLETNGFEVSKENIITLMEELDNDNVAIFDISDLILKEDASDLDYYTQILKLNGFKTNFNNVKVLKEALENGHVLLEKDDTKAEESKKKIIKKIGKNVAIGALVGGAALGATKVNDKILNNTTNKVKELSAATSPDKIKTTVDELNTAIVDTEKAHIKAKQANQKVIDNSTDTSLVKDYMKAIKDKEAADAAYAENKAIVDTKTNELKDIDNKQSEKNKEKKIENALSNLNKYKIPKIVGGIAGTGLAAGSIYGINKLNKARVNKKKKSSETAPVTEQTEKKETD